MIRTYLFMMQVIMMTKMAYYDGKILYDVTTFYMMAPNLCLSLFCVFQESHHNGNRVMMRKLHISLFMINQVQIIKERLLLDACRSPTLSHFEWLAQDKKSWYYSGTLATFRVCITTPTSARGLIVVQGSFQSASESILAQNGARLLARRARTDRQQRATRGGRAPIARDPP